MKKYDYVNVKIGRFVGALSREHRDAIDKHAEMGYRYVGYIPTDIGENGKITNIDLIFEKDC